ncbi:MOSC domain-containing protein [Ottowia sp.]|uniref:MOSC domain-containing protein n=1 Tax=Ottowia sp. TaxID=1898956 RepID=UPI003A854F5C
MTISPSADLRARVAHLFVHPVKSCAGVALSEVRLMDTGLDLDRAWMVVDDTGCFVTQRELPRMALIAPQIKATEVVLRAPGMLALHLDVDRVETPTRATVWRDEVPAWDMGHVAAQWLSDFLGRPGLRLVRFDPDTQRLADQKWTGDVAAPVEFVDGFPLLVVSQASLDELNAKLQAAGHAAVDMARFRPNIVLDGLQAQDEDRLAELRIATIEGAVVLRPCKPCSRCPIPNIDPATGQSSPEVLDTLSTYRANATLNGAITFGMNAVIVNGQGHMLRVGDAVTADWRF